MATLEVPKVELHADGTMVCGRLKARPLRLPARRVWKDRAGGVPVQICDIGPLSTAREFSDPFCELTVSDLLCLAALVDEVGR